jgi:transcriptional regulator with XRE-family HTH domain
VDDAGLGASIRALRHRRGWRQADLARRAGVGGTLVSMVERGFADRVGLRHIRRIAKVLELRLSWDVGFRGAELDRLRDADHAAVAELINRRLERLGWWVRAEVSFNRYGERGRIDLLAYHPASGILLVIEVKTILVDAQALLGVLDMKTRIAPSVARGLGLNVHSVVPCLVVVEGTTNRRRLAQHAHLFGRFVVRGRAAGTWLRAPHTLAVGLLLTVKLPYHAGGDARRAGRQRVRRRTAASSVDGSVAAPPAGRCHA